MGKELRQITTNQIPIWEDALRQGDIAKQCWEVVILKYQDIICHKEGPTKWEDSL